MSISALIARPTRFPLTASTASLLCALSLPSLAAESGGQSFEKIASTEKTLIITATRIDTPEEKLGRSVESIDQSQIKDSQQSELGLYLRGATSVQFNRNGGIGSASSLFIRGAESDHTQIRFNGVNLANPRNGGAPVELMRMAQLGRVEILRGPQSSLYGSGAIGGVISMTTGKIAEGHHGLVRSEYGSRETAIQDAAYSYASETEGFRVAGSNTSSKGISNRDHNTEKDSYRSHSFMGEGFHSLGEVRLDYGIAYIRSENEYDGRNAGSNHDLEQQNRFDVFWLTPSWKLIDDRWEQSIRLSSTGDHLTNLASESKTSDLESRVYNVEFNNTLLTHDNNTLLFGAEFRQDLVETSSGIDTERDNYGVYLEDSLEVNEDWTVTLGGRYDDFETESAWTWNTSTSWWATETTRLHSSFGTGFKQPTINDLYWPATAWTAGNPNLLPEKSIGGDAGVELHWTDNLSSDTTYFWNETEDLIDWDNATGTWIPSNVDKARAWGFEQEIVYVFSDTLAVRANYTWLYTKNLETGNALDRRAKHSGSLSADWKPTKSLTLSATVNYVGSSMDGANKMDDFYTVDTSITWEAHKNLELFVRAENLLDEDYEQINGYNTVGFGLFGGVTAKF